MRAGFRQSMASLHTWAGLLPGWVLYFVFVTGTIGYFYVEIDRWMEPERPLADPRHVLTAAESLNEADTYLRQTAPDALEWRIDLPAGRGRHGNALEISWRSPDGREHELTYDGQRQTFAPSHARDTGGGFALYRMHYKLHYLPVAIGVFVVFFSSLIMLVALLTGTITHKRISRDFFTLRRTGDRRAWLDAHNTASVLSLPFLFMITYSGLAFFAEQYMPAPIRALYTTTSEFFAEGEYRGQAPAHRAAPMLPLTGFLDKAAEYWGEDGGAMRVDVFHPGDANAEVRLWHTGDGTILRDVREQLHFSAVDGRLLWQTSATKSLTTATDSALAGLHEGVFAGPVLRWLYFLSGLLGSIMVASGLVLWTVKRRRKREASGDADFGFRLVECLNIGTIAGLLAGVGAYFWANRLLPVDLASRAAWEMHCLFIVWGAMLAYPAWRPPGRAWVEELAAAAALFGLLPVVNVLTTDRHLGVTLPAGDWALAGFDLTTLTLGIALGVVAFKLRRRCSAAMPGFPPALDRAGRLPESVRE